MKIPTYSHKTMDKSISRIKYIEAIYERQIWEAGFNYAIREIRKINKLIKK